MLTRIVSLSLLYPRLVALAAAIVMTVGGFLLMRSEFEVFPEFVPAQASVQVEAPGMTASQVELLVTQPLEQSINGATGVVAVRSKSIQGLSVIDVTFREGEDPYRARQVVAERISEAVGRLPPNIGAPGLSPLTSSTMDLLKIGLVSDKLSPAELRDLAQWTIKPRLLSTEGVARVNIFGGDLERIEVRIRMKDLFARDLAVNDVIQAVQSVTEIRGGGFQETTAQRIIIEPRGSALTPDGIRQAVLSPVIGPPLRLSDVADVVYAPTPKFGDTLVMGKPGVLLTLATQYGANTLDATKAVETALAELQPDLAAQGVDVYPALHRPANFIETALAGIRDDLVVGSILILVVLIGFTRDWRTALVAFISIPFSLLAAIIIFDVMHLTINTMILGGLAVALGVVIDDAVIGAENILHRLRESAGRPAREVILDAVVEVRAPVVYATVILVLTIAPVLFLTGLQGAFFSPLALAFILAILASLVVAITLTPALAFLLLRSASPPKEPGALRWLKRSHAQLLSGVMGRPFLSLLLCLIIGVAALLGASRFGAELLPAFRERHYVLAVNGPSGASITWMREIGSRLSRDLLSIPGIATVEQQIGRSEAGEDTFPPSQSEFHVELGHVSGSEEDRILNNIRSTLASYPGLETEALTFLGDRIGESLSGETAAIAISVYGPDLDALDRVAGAIAATVQKIPGAVDVRIQTPPGAPVMAVQLDQQKLAMHGVSASDAYDALDAAFQGMSTAQIADGQRLQDVVVTLPVARLRDPEDVGLIPVRGASGSLVALGQVSSTFLTNSRATISHDGGRRRQVVTANADTRDISTLVQQIKQAVSQDVKLPDGVYLEYSGVAEGQAAAQRELLTNVSIAALGIVVTLIVAFGGGRAATLILIGTPSALAGGVLAVAVTGGILSLGSLVGFVALFGIAARNSILLVAHSDQLREASDTTWSRETVIQATTERLTPILMTALVTALGMAPLAFGTGEAGREVQGPMAIVILGGLFTSTLMSLIFLPPLIYRFRYPKEVRVPDTLAKA